LCHKFVPNTENIDLNDLLPDASDRFYLKRDAWSVLGKNVSRCLVAVLVTLQLFLSGENIGDESAG